MSLELVVKEVAKNNKCAKPTGSTDKKRKIRNGSASASKKKAPKVGASMLAKQNAQAVRMRTYKRATGL